MLHDSAGSEPGWRIACLRHCDPVGAHPSGRIGEDPNGIPSDLFPFISQVAAERREHGPVAGGDRRTPDGCCVQDSMHGMDLAEDHQAGLEVLLNVPPQQPPIHLGSGQRHSVPEVIHIFEAARGRDVPDATINGRPDDAAITVLEPTETHRRLGWRGDPA